MAEQTIRLTPQQKRSMRMKAYKKGRLTPTAASHAKRPILQTSMIQGTILPSPTASQEISNFQRFVKENFKYRNDSSDDEFRSG